MDYRKTEREADILERDWNKAEGIAVYQERRAEKARAKAEGLKDALEKKRDEAKKQKQEEQKEEEK